MKKGFTLLEMVLVAGILGILMAVLVSGFGSAPRKAQRAKCQELVSNVATALTAYYNEKGAWPAAVIKASNKESEGVNKAVATVLYNFGMSADTSGEDKLGIVSPYAQLVLRNNRKATLASVVPGGGTIRDHLLRFAVDLDGDGIVEANIGGETKKIRTTAAVWCCGADGKLETYATGMKKDDVYSWGFGQVLP